ncbi:hypothetical protein B0H19DRAFT_933473, partial [Mycena capillaripes]
LATCLYQMAILFSHANERKKADKDNSLVDFTQLLEDLRTRLDEGYLFTKEQMRNIRTQAQDTIYEATRTSFMGMHTDMMQKLRDNKAPLKLNSVFGNPSREKSLVSLVKRTCSSVCNSLRQDIRNGICGDSPATLAEFTYSSATKFKRGGPGLNLDVGYTVHMALLVRCVSCRFKFVSEIFISVVLPWKTRQQLASKRWKTMTATRIWDPPLRLPQKNAR